MRRCVDAKALHDGVVRASTLRGRGWIDCMARRAALARRRHIRFIRYIATSPRCARLRFVVPHGPVGTCDARGGSSLATKQRLVTNHDSYRDQARSYRNASRPDRRTRQGHGANPVRRGPGTAGHGLRRGRSEYRRSRPDPFSRHSRGASLPRRRRRLHRSGLRRRHLRSECARRAGPRGGKGSIRR